MNNTVHDTKPQVRRPQDRRAKDNAGEVPQAHRFRGADAVGLDGGVVALEHVDELRVLAAGHAVHP
ncbi:MAG: hypothetical protein ACRDOU_29685, partial [Streptosporangiaceae bacterium]